MEGITKKSVTVLRACFIALIVGLSVVHTARSHGVLFSSIMDTIKLILKLMACCVSTCCIYAMMKTNSVLYLYITECMEIMSTFESFSFQDMYSNGTEKHEERIVEEILEQYNDHLDHLEVMLDEAETRASQRLERMWNGIWNVVRAPRLA